VEAIGKADSVWRATSADDVTALETSAGVGKLGSEASGPSDTEAKVKVASAASPVSVSSLTTIVTSTITTKTPAATSSTASTFSAASTTTTSTSSVAVASKWGRCGGNGWTGATSCERGSSCTVVNDCEYFYFLQFFLWDFD
jgi:hypothetical protein